MEELERRLRSRGTDPDERIQRRLEIGKEEIKHSEIPGFHDLVVINDDLTRTFAELEQFLFGTVAQQESTVFVDVNMTKPDLEALPEF
jgi:guanylate kinase